jgi:hypothetical protein
VHKTNEAAAPEVVKNAGKTPRSKTFAFIEKHPLDGCKYKFMITATGELIYKKEKIDASHNPEAGEAYQDWKYFGHLGYNTEKISEFKSRQKITIPPIEMVAADGNRVFVKTKGENTFYFAELMKGNYQVNNEKEAIYKSRKTKSDYYLTASPLNDLDKTRDYTRFITKDYGKRLAKETGLKYLKFLLPHKADQGAITNGLLKYCWPVIVEPFTWYKAKANFPQAYEDEGFEVIDIGVFNIQKLTACQEYLKDKEQKIPLHILWAKIGSEYHRDYMKPIESTFSKIVYLDTAGNKIMSGGDLRDYGNFIDGLANYYVLTRQNNQYRIWYIDEQFYFCSNWYRSHTEKDYKHWQARTREVVLSVAATFLKKALGDSSMSRRERENALNQGYRIEWRDIRPQSNPWLWSALETAENPSPENQKPYFPKPFVTKKDWHQPVFEFNNEQEPSLDVSGENVVLCSETKIYSINWSWGSLDYSWYERKKPEGSFGTNIMLDQDMNIYVPGFSYTPGEPDRKRGYYTQTLLPEHNIPIACASCPKNPANNTTYICDNAWKFIEKEFINDHYEFDEELGQSSFR